MNNIAVVPFNPIDLLGFDVQEEQQELFQECTTDEHIIAYGKVLLEIAAEDISGVPCIWTAITPEDGVIFVGGLLRITSTTEECITLWSKKAFKYSKTIVAGIQQKLEESQAIRHQATVKVGFKRAERFLEGLGFQKEGVMRAFNPDGSDCSLYARINNGE